MKKQDYRAKGVAGSAKRERVWLWLSIAGFIVVAALAIHLVSPDRTSNELRAVLIDQLTPAAPNDAFRASVLADMDDFGLPADVVDGSDVDVGLYSRLGNGDYGAVIVRSHSGVMELESAEGGSVTALFTNEPYSGARHVGQQLTDQIVIVRPFVEDARLTFGVTPEFFLKTMSGRFPGTVVVIAGCRILDDSSLAQAFISRGASVVVSWERSVGLQHADTGTAALIHSLFVDELTIDKAVAAAMIEVGPDPDYGAFLSYYPASAGRYTARQLLGR